MDTATEPRDHMYGWEDPSAVSRQGSLAFVLGALVLGTILSSLLLPRLSGAPDAPVWDLHQTLRPAYIVASAATWFWIRNRSTRVLGISTAATLLILGLNPFYSLRFFAIYSYNVIRGTPLPEGYTVLFLLAAVTGYGVASVLALRLYKTRRSKQSAIKGSVQWGDGAPMKKEKEGILIGKKDGQFLRYNGGGHLMTVAATRSGKGVGSIIPNLLNYPGSIVVTDPKGENWYVTARHRREELGQETIPLDPFGLGNAARVPDPTVGFNPLSLIDFEGPNFTEVAMAMADMMVPSRKAAGSQRFWDQEAKALLYTVILHAASDLKEERRNLTYVRHLLTRPPHDFEHVLSSMLASPIAAVREGADRIAQKAEKERSGVFSTVQSETHFLGSPAMHPVLSQTSFDISALNSGKLSLYLMLPREYLSTFAPWLRLMIYACYQTCTHDVISRSKPPFNTLFLLDEFANLGYMSNMSEAVSLGAGYGVSIWFILQDMAQLEREYSKEWKSFMANCDVLQAFAVQDPDTSKHLSTILGKTSVWHRKPRRLSRKEGGRIHHDYSEESRDLLMPDEWRRLHPDRLVLLYRPYFPVAGDKIKYYSDPFFEGKWDNNPYVSASETEEVEETKKAPKSKNPIREMCSRVAKVVKEGKDSVLWQWDTRQIFRKKT